jgi:hypothetical protein
MAINAIAVNPNPTIPPGTGAPAIRVAPDAETGDLVSSSNDRRLKIFLSHSGLDSDRSFSLQRKLEEGFKKLGYRVKVFNTSTIEDRFKELKSVLGSAEDWAQHAEKYEEELRRYLEQNLADSMAYLLLVTPKSLEANSSWIRFEIDTAKSKSLRQRRSFFFPCVANGATLRELPEGAMEFQGLELEASGWLEKLATIIAR